MPECFKYNLHGISVCSVLLKFAGQSFDKPLHGVRSEKSFKFDAVRRCLWVLRAENASVVNYIWRLMNAVFESTILVKFLMRN